MPPSTEQYDVFTGVWTNWSRGNVIGWTLTLSRNNGNLLIKFLATFVAFVGTRFWRIIAFASHSAASSAKPRDVIYRQHQAVIQNMSTATEGFVAVIQVMWAWRLTPGRLWAALGLSALCYMGFLLASGFSSRISNFAGDEVLIKSTRCGYLLPAQNFKVEDFPNIYLPYVTKVFVNGANYAQECYGRNASDANIRLDTELLNSSTHLGLNAPTKNRILFRKVLHCSYLRYHYGNTPYPDISSEQFEYNYTYEYSDSTVGGMHMSPGAITSTGYTLSAVTASWLNGSLHPSMTKFKPIPALVNPRSELLILFLSSNNIPYFTPTTDNWYRATKKLNMSVYCPQLPINTGEIRLPVYGHEEPASPLGCIDQVEVCSAHRRTIDGKQRLCTGLMNPVDVPGVTINILDVDAEVKRAVWKYSLLFAPSNECQHCHRRRQSRDSSGAVLHGSVHSRAFTARSVANRGVAHLLDHIGIDPTSIRPDESKEMCQNQKIRTTAFSSFSMLGLILIILTGTQIILISYLLEPITAILHRKGKYRDYAYYEWLTTSAFQLQRLAHRGVEAGTWTHTLSSVPTTKRGESLAQLDYSNPKQPLLVFDKPMVELSTINPNP
ncbi:hypothetical protein QBC38DRAFT_459135 [Podospora fimiseda]|uniref:Uncharacterized protein n=1 Tax=Podospora fimiseda TaxID=252190 RepID=A0AAN7BHV3_9PEZI|nr:hypothetical protein QBC38DRAFT_459135 [Podospora fimiseda]